MNTSIHLKSYCNPDTIPPTDLLFCTENEDITKEIALKPKFNPAKHAIIIPMGEELFGFYQFSARFLKRKGICENNDLIDCICDLNLVELKNEISKQQVLLAN